MTQRPRRHNPVHIRHKPYQSLEQSFWKRVYIPQDLMQCWLWLGTTNGVYGTLATRGGIRYGKIITWYAHRLSYTIFYGPIPDQYNICHDCPDGDNPLCVNPRHLFMATTKDNLADMRRKGRHKDATTLIAQTRNASQAIIDDIRVYRTQMAMKTAEGLQGDGRRKLRKSLEDRFWEKVQKSPEPNGCWLWTACKTNKGYGQIALGRREEGRMQAHRLSYILHYGPILPMFEVLHNCPTGDNPSCVNPQHLLLDTHAENMADAAQKKMMAHGEQRTTVGLTLSTVQEIRRLYHEDHVRQVDLMVQFGLSSSHINKIVHHRIWS